MGTLPLAMPSNLLYRPVLLCLVCFVWFFFLFVLCNVVIFLEFGQNV